ncbi:MAG: TIGR04211 family SH3 domain-containing protein [Pseudomonadales bacterium]
MHAPDHRSGPRAPTLLLAFFAVMLAAAPLRAETAYIVDELLVPLRSGPSTSYRILHRGLPSGTALDVLERDSDSGYARVRTPSGTEGWVPIQYLVSQPIARDQLAAARRDMEAAKKAAADLRGQLEALRRDKGQAEESNESLSTQVSRLEQELAEIKRVSAGALETEAENKRLTELNARLRGELDALVDELETAHDNVQERWLMIGGGLVLLGLVLGVAIKARPRRSAWN